MDELDTGRAVRHHMMSIPRKPDPAQAQEVREGKRCPWCWWLGPPKEQCQKIAQAVDCTHHCDD